MNENKREQIYLAALLHDIGKFYQRADKSFSDKYNTLSDYSKRVANMICPLNDNGRFGYQHVIWTSEFLEENTNIINKIPAFKQNNFDNKNAEDSFISFACNHHNPKTELQAIVTLADWWSAGIDRTDPKTLEQEELDSEKNIKWGKYRYKHIPLYSVFNSINEGNYCSGFKLQALSIQNKKCFPTNIDCKADGVSENDYYNLWSRFDEEFQKLPADSFNGFSESLLYLLKKYTWCIPSNTMDMSNVSLFEHLKTTAAIADCLFLYMQENPNMFTWDSVNRRLSINDGSEPVILLGGDISGIQKFIYNISSKNAAVSLKGRSFYLQLVIDSVIQRIISHPDINCSIGQVVYSSGGKFYMLLPNTKKVKDAILELKSDLENGLWNDHYGQLVLNMDYISFSYDNKCKNVSFAGCKADAKIGDLWKYLADKLNSCKYTKFKTMLLDKFDTMFQPIEVGASTREDVCSITGIEGECVKMDDNDNNEYSPKVLKAVKTQVDLGKTLKDADYIVTFKSENGSDYLSKHSHCNIGVCNIYNYLFDKQELVKDDAEFRDIISADVCRVKMINETNFLAAPLKGSKVSYGFQFYGGNKQAVNSSKDGNPNKTFEELSDGSYLGVLRMDVDNLGSIFIKGLPNESRSFAAYSTLSFLLDYYFSGYLNTIRDKDEYRDYVNILYSGGDDVFAVGKWDKLLLFAEEVRRDFQEFVGRPDITISAGITIVNSKFPISKAAQLAGEAEDNAKKYRINNKVKNAINIFGESVSWENEFEYVKEHKKQFVNHITNSDMPKSILHKIIDFYEIKMRGDYSYAWNMAYFITRFKNGNYADYCDVLQAEILNNDRNFALIVVAARWAELELKNN